MVKAGFFGDFQHFSLKLFLSEWHSCFTTVQIKGLYFNIFLNLRTPDEYAKYSWVVVTDGVLINLADVPEKMINAILFYP